MTIRNQWLVLSALVLLCLAVGALGGLATAQSVSSWYLTLNRPAWTPPDWVFGPVWTLLYLMMALAAWLVWKSGRDVRTALVLFFAQLALNFAWSFLFFGARSPLLGLIDIVALLAAVIATAIAFYRRSRLAGLLIVPYAGWVSFAAALNFAIWRLN